MYSTVFRIRRSALYTHKSVVIDKYTKYIERYTPKPLANVSFSFMPQGNQNLLETHIECMLNYGILLSS